MPFMLSVYLLPDEQGLQIIPQVSPFVVTAFPCFDGRNTPFLLIVKALYQDVVLPVLVENELDVGRHTYTFRAVKQILRLTGGATDIQTLNPDVCSKGKHDGVMPETEMCCNG